MTRRQRSTGDASMSVPLLSWSEISLGSSASVCLRVLETSGLGRSSASLCAKVQCGCSHLLPLSTDAHILVQRKSGAGTSSASECANMQDEPFLHPLPENLHILVLRNLCPGFTAAAALRSWLTDSGDLRIKNGEECPNSESD